MSNTPELTSSTSKNTVTEWDTLGKEVPFPGATSPNPSLDPNQESEQTSAPVELPTSSPNHTCNFYIREIKNSGRAPAVAEFLRDALAKDYQEFSANTPEYDQFTNSYAELLDSTLDYPTKSAIHEYSGNGYKAMNQVARGFWDYEVLGKKTPEAFAHAQALNEKLHSTILSAPSPDIDFVTYRGTDLNTFRGYNANSISELKNLQNQFFLETGFCSTSLLQNQSFTNTNFDADMHKNHNIEIKYLIPKDSQECIGLLTHDLSQYPDENEFLINQDSLSYISKVEVAPDQSSAKLEMTLIPRHIYDPAYSRDNTATSE